MVPYDDRRMGWPFALLNIDQPAERQPLPLPSYPPKLVESEEERAERATKDVDPKLKAAETKAAETKAVEDEYVDDDVRAPRTYKAKKVVPSKLVPRTQEEIITELKKIFYENTLMKDILVELKKYVAVVLGPNARHYEQELLEALADDGDEVFRDRLIKRIINDLVGPKAGKDVNPPCEGWYTVSHRGMLTQYVSWFDGKWWRDLLGAGDTINSFEQLDKFKKSSRSFRQMRWYSLLSDEDLRKKFGIKEEVGIVPPIELEEAKARCIAYFNQYGGPAKEIIRRRLSLMGYRTVPDLSPGELQNFMDVIDNDMAAHKRSLSNDDADGL